MLTLLGPGSKCDAFLQLLVRFLSIVHWPKVDLVPYLFERTFRKGEGADVIFEPRSLS